MPKITDTEMRKKPGKTGHWMSEPAIWGHGSLVGRVTRTGERLFYFRYLMPDGTRDTLMIGTYHPEGSSGCMSVADARTRALELANLHKSGIHNVRAHLETEARAREAEQAARISEHESQVAKIAAEKAAAEAEAARLAGRKTIRAAFQYWHDHKISNRKDGGASVLRMFNTDVLPILGDRYMADVRRGEVMEIIDRIQKRGANEMARETFTCLRQLFRFAHSREWIDADPTVLLSKKELFGKKEERERVLSEAEIKEISQKLPNAGMLITTQLAVWIALSTGCRIGNLMTARWEHIDLDKGVWFVPDTKNGKPFTVYLSSFAARQFRTLKVVNGFSEWCYPNRANTNHVSEKTVTKQVVDRQLADGDTPMKNRTKHVGALNLAGGKWTMHDLRRTAATLMTSLKVLPEVADKCLAHIEENKVRRIYLRHDYTEEMREAWRVLGARLELLTHEDADNVVPLKRA